MGAAAGNSEIYEKLGINNQLLPSGETIPFARRRDLVQAEGAYDEASQSAKAQLGWAIDDAAIAQVNEHFAHLQSTQDRAAMGLSAENPALLVVDELGQLELKRGGGLTQAVTLLREGPSRQFPHAIIVVREWLVDDAVAQLGVAWKDYAPIGPTDDARARILGDFGLAIGDAATREAAVEGGRIERPN